ncbi:MAG: hypothetical protein KDI46_02345 [Alphaproteobacteria bacterium]|nr:hypothetical protein [Alphaproteobacteria bacterium]
MSPIYYLNNQPARAKTLRLGLKEIHNITAGLKSADSDLHETLQTPAQHLETLYHTIAHSFAHMDLPADQRERINAFTLAIHNMFETIAEQDQSAAFFTIEHADLHTIAENIDCVGMAIRIQHTNLQHHDVSAGLLRAKTALRQLTQKHIPASDTSTLENKVA